MTQMDDSQNTTEKHPNIDYEQERRLRNEAYREASIPILVDLLSVGLNIEFLDDLFNRKTSYKKAIPLLLYWLPLVTNIDVKETIVRALSVPWAKRIAGYPLVAEFHRLHNESNIGIKWTIANALAQVADDSIFQDIVELLRDPSNGKSREMLAVALGNMQDARAVDVLIDLLNDNEVAGHAIIGLGKLKSRKALPHLKHFLDHPKAWVRKEAEKAIIKIERRDK